MAAFPWRQTCLAFCCLFQTLATLSSPQQQGTDQQHRTFRVENPDWTFSHLAVDSRNGNVYLGAVNQIFKLSPGLEVQASHQTGPEEDNRKCYPPRIVQPCGEPLTLTNNVNKLLLLDYRQERLLACGSVFQGICKLLRLDDLFKLGEPSHRKEHYLSGHNHSGSVVGVIVSHGDGQVTDRLFVATAVGGEPEYFPTISSRQLARDSEAEGMFAYVFHDEFVASMIKVPSDTFTVVPDFDIHYVYGFASGAFVYFLTLQPEMGRPGGAGLGGGAERVYTSKLVRLCKDDPAFNSYVEVPLGCASGGAEYRLLQAAHLAPAGTELAHALGVELGEHVLYAIFSQGRKRREGNGVQGSALCVFPLRQINTRIKERLQSCYRGEGTLDLAWLKVKDIPCSSALLTIYDNFCGLDMNAPLGVSEMVLGVPLMSEELDKMTSVIAYVYKNHSLAFVGTQRGQLKKLA
ncbi:hypothetical protein AAFF_G00177660 [Aldrovandia affinis]|uniref:Sema domain-containing protein n=1 Tax=Aldrovandia affinis TaxID=143900 RepID=A0AAD7RLD5_9TELE|nr:hypothetical protein AAFF_G00177660 [Aldrovandia affinis]